MYIEINTHKLKEEGLSVKELGVLLYYLGGGTGTLDEELCDSLWNKGMLIRDIFGYTFNPPALYRFEQFAGSDYDNDQETRMFNLAKKLQALYPEGKKDQTCLMWRDSTLTIARRLLLLKEKFKAEFTDEEAIEATQRYVEQFYGDDKMFMKLLKYFIYQKRADNGEETSELMSYIENKD